MNYQFQLNEETINLQLEKASAGYALTLNGQAYQVEAANLHEGELRFMLNVGCTSTGACST